MGLNSISGVAVSFQNTHSFRCVRSLGERGGWVRERDLRAVQTAVSLPCGHFTCNHIPPFRSTWGTERGRHGVTGTPHLRRRSPSSHLLRDSKSGDAANNSSKSPCFCRTGKVEYLHSVFFTLYLAHLELLDDPRRLHLHLRIHGGIHCWRRLCCWQHAARQTRDKWPIQQTEQGREASRKRSRWSKGLRGSKSAPRTKPRCLQERRRNYLVIHVSFCHPQLGPVCVV